MRSTLVAAGLTALGLLAGPAIANAQPGAEDCDSASCYHGSYESENFNDNSNKHDIRWNEANGLVNVINDRDDGGIVNIGNHYHK